MKIGLVFAGGGARGAYQIGVWKALIELGIDKYIDVVSGTSIGALNAVLFQQGDYKLAEEFWKSVTSKQIVPINEKELGIKSVLFALGAKSMPFVKRYIPKVIKSGTLARDGLNRFLERIDFEAVKKSHIKVYATCTRIPEIKAEYFCINENSIENIRKILFATSAIPMIYDSEKIDAMSYLDGGIVDNVPIQPVYGESCDVIIVVKSSKDNKVDRTKFPNTKIIEITPEEIESTDLKEILNFDKNIINKRLAKGYRDTIYMLKPIMEIAVLIEQNKIVNKKKGVQLFKDKYFIFK